MFTGLMLFATVYFLAGMALAIDGIRRLARKPPKLLQKNPANI